MTVQNTARYEHSGSGSSGIAMASFTVEDGPVLSISKWVTPTSEVTFHSEITYTVLLTNTG